MVDKINKFKRSLGQNFLFDQGYLVAIAQAATAGLTGMNILELAAGNGNLTEQLCSYARKVVAIEIDDRWCEELKNRFSGCPAVSVVKEDIKKADFSSCFKDGDSILVGNLPYNIASPVMLRFGGFKKAFSSFTVLIQKDVAQRVVASPGKKAYSVLSVLLAIDFEAELLFDVPGSAFYPVPKVVSSLVRLTPNNFDIDEKDRNSLVKLIKAAFYNRRKTIINSLVRSGAFPAYGRNIWEDMLNRSGIDPQRRGETLSLEEFNELYLSESNLRSLSAKVG
ncbi:MAG: 16S rRNA (adenine(1518)-N(6)/adenine(1519)-N(6))-dimethyltransferase RsmA [bacterium]